MQQNSMFRKLVFLVWNYLVLLAEEAWHVVIGQAKKSYQISLSNKKIYSDTSANEDNSFRNHIR